MFYPVCTIIAGRVSSYFYIQVSTFISLEPTVIVISVKWHNNICHKLLWALWRFSTSSGQGCVCFIQYQTQRSPTKCLETKKYIDTNKKYLWRSQKSMYIAFDLQSVKMQMYIFARKHHQHIIIHSSMILNRWQQCLYVMVGILQTIWSPVLLLLWSLLLSGKVTSNYYTIHQTIET